MAGDTSLGDGIDAVANVQAVSYEIEIDGNGANADTFLWKKNGVTQGSGITITGNKQAELETEGLYILFHKTQGYTLGTSWLLTVKDDTDHDGMPDEWESSMTTFTQPEPQTSHTQSGLSVSGSYTGLAQLTMLLKLTGWMLPPAITLFVGALAAFKRLKTLPLSLPVVTKRLVMA